MGDILIEVEDMSDKEYPLIKSVCKNSYYAGLLQNLYSGSEGETISFLQLRYHSFILQQFNNRASKILSEIAICELKHQELLAHAIQMCSSDPIFANSQGKWLGGRQIDYVKDTRQILRANLEQKEKSIIDYKLAISKIENNQIKILLTSILSDEENHRLILKKLIQEIN